jgi:imidazole glycerol-phosphate synthase subunit HisH
VIVDYGSGNIRSLRAALERCGTQVAVSNDPDLVGHAQRLVVPGQGAAGPAMRTLNDLGLADAIRGAVADGAFLLGVCVGLQLLFDHSDENDTDCFGFLPGRVTRLTGVARLPHVGWNDVTACGPTHPVTADLPACAYFAHSYAVSDAAAAALATTAVDTARFCSIVGAGRILGVQFHPERSSTAGHQMLHGFLDWCDAA